MFLIILIVVLSVLRFFEISIFALIPWWWILGLVIVAVIWFELIERWLGLDQKRAHEALEEARKERVKKAFDKLWKR